MTTQRPAGRDSPCTWVEIGSIDPQGGRHVARVESSRWDADAEDIVQYLREAMAGKGYAEATIKEVFGDE